MKHYCIEAMNFKKRSDKTCYKLILTYLRDVMFNLVLDGFHKIHNLFLAMQKN